MSSITIRDLSPTVSELTSDSSSYMNEMSEGELTGVLGGCGFLCGVLAGLTATVIYDIVT